MRRINSLHAHTLELLPAVLYNTHIITKNGQARTEAQRSHVHCQAPNKSLPLHVSLRCFDLNLPEKIISDTRICESGSQKIMHYGGYDAKLKIRLLKSSSLGMKILVAFIRSGIAVREIY